MIRPYELMVILDSRQSDTEIEGVLTKVSDLIRLDGNLARTDRWGRKKLAFEINKAQEGFYVVFEFTASPATVAEIARVLSITDSVLRHKVMRMPEHKEPKVLAMQADIQE